MSPTSSSIKHWRFELQEQYRPMMKTRSAGSGQNWDTAKAFILFGENSFENKLNSGRNFTVLPARKKNV
jgi:hypothetical protein